MFRESLALILLAGLMNGSFTVPIRYVKGLSNAQIWLYHTLIGMALMPWVLLWITAREAFSYYTTLNFQSWALLLGSGLIFGIGQICFARAISLLGLALGFVINLGIGIAFGSLSVIVLKGLLFTTEGAVTIFAMLLVMAAMLLHYLAGKGTQRNLGPQNKLSYQSAWVFAIFAGIGSGLQNFSFVLVAFHLKNAIALTNSFWFWPPFLVMAALPMALYFFKASKQHSPEYPMYQGHAIKNFVMIVIMGACFTGSLELYSESMNHLTHRQQIIGWPVLMLSIILTAQAWGWVYRENVVNKWLKIGSLSFLMASILLLAFGA